MVSRFTRSMCEISSASSMSPSSKVLRTSGESTVSRILRRTSLKLLRHYGKSSHRDPTSWLLGITRRTSTRYACDVGRRNVFHSQLEGRYIRFWVTFDARDKRFSSGGPSGQRRPGEWIGRYAKRRLEASGLTVIDTFLLTHLH